MYIYSLFIIERGLLPLCGGLGGALGGPGDGGLADDPDVALRDVAEQALVPRPVVPAHAHQLSHTAASSAANRLIGEVVQSRRRPLLAARPL